MDEFNRTFKNTVNDMLIDQMTNLESSKLRFLVVALLHPLETESDIDFWKTIIKYITRSNANETLKQWFKNFDQDILQRIVNSLLKFFDEPKANKLYTFNQDVARVLSIIYFANKERKSQILPVSSFIHKNFSNSLNPIQDLKNTSSYIENFSWFFDIEQKTKFLDLKIEDFVNHLPNDTKDRQTFEIEVNPKEDNVLEKFKMKLTQKSDFVIFLPIVIRDGSGILDGGDLRNEFFSYIEKELISGDNPILKKCSNNYYWFNEDFNDIEMLKIIGTIFGCMIINHWHLGYSFPLFFYEKLLYDDPPEIVVMPDDKSSDDGIIKSSLEHADSEEDINRHNENSESSDCTEFTNDEDNSSSSEKNGSEGEISESEKMSEKGKMQLDAFITGFRKIRENCILECFDPKELKQLMESSKVEKNEKYNF
ncbi:hypothetical protein TVAG_117300 [Trichomonas vaginalis G3]|uniref:HECT domain-containing protein n=1 Tax=Trichomonas vaginalis (strain ATCC PRA-98 / G3) TaxID=412133 RepID=A2E3S0_TRIV3|nr:guanyl-nucleotide exchange factor protein [Trichomonas vaginalis G3]EAY12708.1 hypothetical protein TVAG_117300 [Trichomonas vaginalis G3]KAI5517530.1 guanyl-nucleotide exchange factor protein [Trichomonas vaginalis G3]|eukprot:XP_001324931.1 hypothetical protein [Trichomonas vaginalis G3]